MVLFKFGDFDWACRDVPSLPICNLFFRQLLVNPRGIAAPATELLGLPAADSPDFASTLANFAPGVNPSCYIRRMGAAGGQSGSLGNIANIAACGLAVIVAVALALAARRRQAAVGRVEISVFFLMYALVQGANLADTGGMLRAGSLVLTWVSAVHIGLLVGLFWVLAWLAFLSLQIVEDGTLASFIPMTLIGIILTVGSGYIAADTGLTITDYFQSTPPERLHSIWLFVLTIIWPAAAAAFYFVVQLGVVVRVLKEKKPLALFAAAAVAFILAQGAYFGLGYKMCSGTDHKVDSSFLATFLETISVGLIFVAWKSITEDTWDGVAYME